MFTKGTETKNPRDITNGYFFPSQKELKGKCPALPFKKTSKYLYLNILFLTSKPPPPPRVLEVG